MSFAVMCLQVQITKDVHEKWFPIEFANLWRSGRCVVIVLRCFRFYCNSRDDRCCHRWCRSALRGSRFIRFIRFIPLSVDACAVRNSFASTHCKIRNLIFIGIHRAARLMGEKCTKTIIIAIFSVVLKVGSLGFKFTLTLAICRHSCLNNWS